MVDILSQPIDRLELNVRAVNALRRNNIAFVGDLIRKTRKELKKTPNTGKKTIKVIEDALAAWGLRLDMQEVDVEELQNRIRDLDTFIDVVMFVRDAGTHQIKELLELTQQQLQNPPFNLSSEQLAIIERGLWNWGLAFGAVAPAPSLPQIACCEEVDNFKDELLCIVRQIFSKHRPNLAACFISHHGLDGNDGLTLEDIGGRAFEFGFDRAVTRERIRQIVDRAREIIRQRACDVRFRWWDSSVRRSREMAPTRIEPFLAVYGYDSAQSSEKVFWKIKFISEVFQLDFSFDLIPLDNTSVVVGLDDQETAGAFFKIQELQREPYYLLEDVAGAISCDENLLKKVIDMHPEWEMLDDEERYIWRKPSLPPIDHAHTGNAILTALCKIFSVAKAAKVCDLVDSISRSRNIGYEVPTVALEGIATKSGLFDVREGRVTRRKDQQWFTLGPRDIALVRICVEMGQIMSSNALYSSLVRHGLSTQNANITVVHSPFLVHVQAGRGSKEGIYKFVFFARRH